MQLNDLRDNAGARRPRKRVGRGLGSGTGKTSARGQKGQGARAGVAVRTFEGGQMPLHRRLPRRGFKNPTRLAFAVVNLDRLQAAVDAGRLDPKAAVDAEAMITAGLIRRELDGVRVLARGELKVALTIQAAGASKLAIEAVAKAGGSLTVREPSPEAIAAKQTKSENRKKKAKGKSKSDD